jgi:hypothetical protein
MLDCTRMIAALGFMLAMTGCSSFSGQQRTLRTTDLSTGYAHLLSSDRDATDYSDAGATPTVRKLKRNVVVLKLLMAIDDRYDSFTANLSREMRGTNLGLDLSVLALTGLGSVISDAAPELAAGATAVGGMRASMNKELYLERTLPAILVIMDANRLRIRTTIRDHLRLDDAEYSLEEAMMEVREYERAGNLNRAITELTSQAGVVFAAAERTYAASMPSCEPPSDLRAPRRDITNALLALYQSFAAKGVPAAGSADDATLGRIAAFMTANTLSPAAKATNAVEFDAQRAAISRFLLRTCTLDETNRAKAALLGG